MPIPRAQFEALISHSEAMYKDIGRLENEVIHDFNSGRSATISEIMKVRLSDEGLYLSFYGDWYYEPVSYISATWLK